MFQQVYSTVVTHKNNDKTIQKHTLPVISLDNRAHHRVIYANICAREWERPKVHIAWHLPGINCPLVGSIVV